MNGSLYEKSMYNILTFYEDSSQLAYKKQVANSNNYPVEKTASAG